MIQFMKNVVSGMKLLWPFGPITKPLAFTRLIEKFDVVARTPVYAKIKA